ncbi:hypothetical protein AVDCRST_MAG94-5009 [uncultured Leptolyngbya sp.]|uniref:Uncharacterized protein n=1 Tax=uncultured Leptolyngbya sp. TaxID=332963 RepID=A0A6J4NI08_9CYAN|nr:hypothetical protein AVDCRST_MAG94-5009 [uncultured Leptolyngbya sp.]
MQSVGAKQRLQPQLQEFGLLLQGHTVAILSGVNADHPFDPPVFVFLTTAIP